MDKVDKYILNLVKGIQREFNFDEADLLMDRYHDGEFVDLTTENLQEAIDAFMFVYAIMDMLHPERIKEKTDDEDDRRDASKCN